jgi:hypothetical protein
MAASRPIWKSATGCTTAPKTTPKRKPLNSDRITSRPAPLYWRAGRLVAVSVPAIEWLSPTLGQRALSAAGSNQGDSPRCPLSGMRRAARPSPVPQGQPVWQNPEAASNRTPRRCPLSGTQRAARPSLMPHHGRPGWQNPNAAGCSRADQLH